MSTARPTGEREKTGRGGRGWRGRGWTDEVGDQVPYCLRWDFWMYEEVQFRVEADVLT